MKILSLAIGIASMGVAFVQGADATGDRHPFFDGGLYPEWSELTPQQGAIDVRAGMEIAKKRLAAIREVQPQQATYENVFAAFEGAQEEMERAASLLGNLSATMDNDELRKVQEELIPEMTRFQASITADEKLWGVIKAAASASWVKKLSPEKQRFVQQVVDIFRDSGADLSPERKERLTEILSELSTLAHQFDKNLLDATKAWKLVVHDPAELAGMPEVWMRNARESALKAGFGTEQEPCWLITLQEPSVIEVIRSCDVEATRKRCWEAYSSIGSKAPYDNAGIVARVMMLRREMAELLGFDNFADLQLAHRMAGSGKKAMDFIDDMMKKVKPAFDDEVKQLLDFIAQCKGVESDKLNPWDSAYYQRKLAKERYSFDTELLRPYLECNRVIKGMFAIYEHLYSIRIRELPTRYAGQTEKPVEGAVSVWHPEVRVFAVEDVKTGQHLGSFYMDLFPRSSKRVGAWVQPMHYGTPAHDGKPHTSHLALLAGNLSPATADSPALFSHRDAETIFHEFGHMMHCMLGDTELRTHCGTSVTWDFVELPSQMNENWTWEPESLVTFAFHYKTGERIPDDYVKKLQSVRFFFPAHDNMGQLCIAKLDMEMHTHYIELFRGKDLDAATQELLGPWKAPYSVQPPSIMRNLSHCISGGYAAGYYSYKWSEVLAADVFTKFLREGILNPAVGAEYREKILSKGDSKPAGELYRDFMGRDPNPDALLEKQGLNHGPVTMPSP